MPRDDTPMTLHDRRTACGPRAAATRRRDRLQAVVTIPGRTSLRFSSAGMTVVDNARYEPEQILLLDELVAGRRARACRRRVGAAAAGPPSAAAAGGPAPVPMGRRQPRSAPTSSRSPTPSPSAYVPSDEGGNTSHGFKFLAPVGRYLHVTVKDGVQGTGGYISGKPLRRDRQGRALPAGADVPRPGRAAVADRRPQGRLPVARRRERGGRDRPRAAEPAAAPRAADVGLLAARALRRTSRTSSSSASPRRATTAASSRASRPTTASTSASISTRRRARHGAASSCSTSARGARCGRSPTTCDEEGDSRRRCGVIEDTRLILVTDLGFIVKQAKDGSRDVFVQSIRTGLPVAGARIEHGRQQRPAGVDGDDRRHRPRAAAEAVADGARREKDAAADPGAEGRRHVVHAVPHRAGASSTSRASTPAASKAPRRRSSCRPTCSPIAASIGRARRRTSGVITRTADWKASLAGLPLDRRDHRSARPGRQPHRAEAVGRRRSTRSPTRASQRRRPAPTRRSPIS